MRSTHRQQVQQYRDYIPIKHIRWTKKMGEIPQLFKGAKPKQTRGRGKPKGKPQEQRQNPLKAQEADETYTCDAAQVWGGPRAATEHTKECLLSRRPGC